MAALLFAAVEGAQAAATLTGRTLATVFFWSISIKIYQY
jgi:hypothetical protein